MHENVQGCGKECCIPQCNECTQLIFILFIICHFTSEPEEISAMIFNLFCDSKYLTGGWESCFNTKMNLKMENNNFQNYNWALDEWNMQHDGV